MGNNDQNVVIYWNMKYIFACFVQYMLIPNMLMNSKSKLVSPLSQEKLNSSQGRFSAMSIHRGSIHRCNYTKIMETLYRRFSWFLHNLYIKYVNVQYADSTFLWLLAESKSDVFIYISSTNR
jgi:hypothetical protein